MKALSIQQPWAHAVLRWKPIENRVRSDGRMPGICRHRGPLLIHASVGIGSLQKFTAAVNRIMEIVPEGEFAFFRDAHLDIRTWRGDTLWVPRASLLRGGIVGIANAVGHVEPSGRVYRGVGNVYDPHPGEDMRWHDRGAHGLVLHDRRPLPFVRLTGMLGLFDVPAALVPKALEAAR